MFMKLSDLIKDLIKSKKDWLKEIARSDEKDPILYLNEYKTLDEYRLLHFLARNNILYEKENRVYSTFTITKKGTEVLAKFDIKP